MLEKIDHVAFAHTSDSPIHRILCDVLGTSIVHEEAADGFVERMLSVGDGYVQTLEATGPGIVQSFIDRRGPGLHHIAFSVGSVESAVESLRPAGVRIIDPAPRRGSMDTSIAFVHPASLGGLLVELTQRDPRA